MKLNPDCMRDILLEMEKLSFGTHLSFKLITEKLPHYSEDDLRYSCQKLYEAGFVDALTRDSSQGILVLQLKDITYVGHQFLADVRSDTVWNDVKEVSKKVGSNSINAISQIASNVITAIIKAQLGLT